MLISSGGSMIAPGGRFCRSGFRSEATARQAGEIGTTQALSRPCDKPEDLGWIANRRFQIAIPSAFARKLRRDEPDDLRWIADRKFQIAEQARATLHGRSQISIGEQPIWRFPDRSGPLRFTLICLEPVAKMR